MSPIYRPNARGRAASELMLGGVRDVTDGVADGVTDGVTDNVTSVAEALRMTRSSDRTSTRAVVTTLAL